MSKIFPQPLRTKIQPRRILPINRRTSAVLVATVSAADKARCELLWLVVMIFPGHVKTRWLVKFYRAKQQAIDQNVQQSLLVPSAFGGKSGYSVRRHQCPLFDLKRTSADQ